MAKAWDWIKLHVGTVLAAVAGLFFFVAMVLVQSTQKARPAPMPPVLDPTKAQEAERAKGQALVAAQAVADRRTTVEAQVAQVAKPTAQETAVGDMSAAELADEWERLKRDHAK